MTRRGDESCSASSAWSFAAAGRTAQADETINEALAAATEAMDARIGYRAQLELAYVAIQRDPGGKDAVLLDVAEKAIPMFEELGDDRGLARAWLLAGWVHGGIHGQQGEGEEPQNVLSSITAGPDSSRAPV